MNDSMYKIPVGVSSCLLGQRVRYDGGHKRNLFVIDDLGAYFDYQAFCPEVAAGMGTPRETIRLVGINDEIRAVGTENNDYDVTDLLRNTSLEQQHWQQNIYGYILKKDSPSCGMERVKVYRKNTPKRDGMGIFAKVLLENFPELPVEEEGRLNDATLRENFVQRVLVYYRWRQLKDEGLSMKQWTEFHAKHKWIFFSHNQVLARKLGKLLADTRETSKNERLPLYSKAMMELLKIPATRRNHSNVLQHIQGFIKNQLTASEKAELGQTISDYREGLVPLIVPITLLRHHFMVHPNQYINNSYYLEPHPKDLKLLNTI